MGNSHHGEPHIAAAVDKFTRDWEVNFGVAEIPVPDTADTADTDAPPLALSTH